MARIHSSLLILALSGALAACADLPPGDSAATQGNGGWSLPGNGQPAPTPQSAAASEPEAVLAAKSDADEAAESSEQLLAEPIIIRGNDKVVAPPAVPGNAPAHGAATRLNFEGAPAAQVVNVLLHDLLKVDYVVHPPISGTITLTTPGEVSADRALLLLETALQANGIVMARDARGTYHVGTPDALKGIVSAPVLAQAGKPLPPGYGAVIIPLQYLGAQEMANIMKPLVADDAILRVDTVRNLLVMRGTRAEAEGWLDLVKTFDVNLLRGMSVGVFPLKYSSTKEIEAALNLLSGGVADSSQSSAAAAIAANPRGGRNARAVQAAQAAANAAESSTDAAAGMDKKSPLYGALRIIPIERINAIMVVTPRAAYLDEARYWIEQFDRPNLNSSDPQLFVYKVQNSSALHLAELLNGIYSGGIPGQRGSGDSGVAPALAGSADASGAASPNSNLNSSFAGRYSSGNNRFGGGGFGNAGFGNSGFGNSGFGNSGFGNRGFGGSGGFGGFGGMGGMNNGQQGADQGPAVVTTMLGQTVRVMADQINNTLLIHATPAEYEKIASTLKRLDVQRAQVLIEASIVEVTLSDGLQYGLQWAFRNGVGGSHSGIGLLGSAGLGQGALDPGSATSFTYSVLNSAGNVNAVLHALASKQLVKVISSPSLMVLDNHTAAIQVGTQEPVNTGSTISSGINGLVTTNIQYKDTGVMLGVTPSVSAGDLVTLDIDQIVSKLGNDSTARATSGFPTFDQREINSKVAVRSGQTLVLGGLIQDETQRGSSGLPLLSSIPVVGGLFGTKDNSNKRTELLVVLTPRVLRSDEDARAVSAELRDRMRGLLEDGQTVTLPPSGRD